MSEFQPDTIELLDQHPVIQKVEDVGKQMLWESVQSFIHADGEAQKDSYLLYQRVGKLEANVGALNLSIHTVSAFKTQLDEAVHTKRMEKREIKEMVRGILRESLVDEPDDYDRY